MVPLLLRKEARGGGEAATSYCFVSSGHEAVDGGRLPAFRSPPSPLRTPTYRLLSGQTLAGRGGSVSRRDHNQPAENRAHLTGGTKPKETPPPERQPLFGREGSGGRGASLREAASPPSVPPKPCLFRRGPGGGCFSIEKHPPPEFHSPCYHTIAAISWMARSAWGTTVLLLRKQRMTGASLKMTPTSFVIPSSSPVLCAI